jgi:hypothetical protein
MVEKVVKDGCGGLSVCGGLVAEADAMQHSIFGECEQVVGHDVIASVQEGTGAACLNEGESGAG